MKVLFRLNYGRLTLGEITLDLDSKLVHRDGLAWSERTVVDMMVGHS
jgi:hypothetical protein